jgi:1,4-alpha-glucan branching enzyme
MVWRAALLVALCLGFLSTAARMQEPPVLVSPDVRPDRTVVFRYWAPRATSVQLSGDFMSGPPFALAKDGQGVWSVTQGPLER